MARLSGLDLPGPREVREMIELESPRKAVRLSLLSDEHKDVVDALNTVLSHAHLESISVVSLQAAPFDDALGYIARAIGDLEAYLAHSQDDALASELYKALNYQVTPRQSDLIFVFGSALHLRTEKAVELYKSSIAPRIMVTGKRPHWDDSEELSEAERAARYAVGRGVSSEDILVESRSIAIPDNVKRGIDMLEELNWRPARITMVTSEYNLRRAFIDIQKFLPWRARIYTASPFPSSELGMYNWIKAERGRRIILNEYAKILFGYKVDQLVHGEIE